MSILVGTELNNKISHLKNTTKFPVTEDLNGAAVAITRLQDTYDLETADIAKGVLGGHCCADTLHGKNSEFFK
jgi:prolyl 4-hydroxylase